MVPEVLLSEVVSEKEVAPAGPVAGVLVCLPGAGDWLSVGTIMALGSTVISFGGLPRYSASCGEVCRRRRPGAGRLCQQSAGRVAAREAKGGQIRVKNKETPPHDTQVERRIYNTTGPGDYSYAMCATKTQRGHNAKPNVHVQSMLQRDALELQRGG